MKIGIIGTGYVGLVTGVCLGKVLNNDIVCIDKVEEKINLLNNKQCPIFEPGLTKLLNSSDGGNIRFTTNYNELLDRDLIFLCVGTPQNDNGSTNYDYLISCMNDLADVIEPGTSTYIVIKSTAPVGSADILKSFIANKLESDRGLILGKDLNIHISSNPEFLKEGSAVEDFLNPSRIVIGTDDSESKNRLLKLYETYSDKCFCTDVKSAQLIKYASNAFLATKISFVNSLITYCEENNINLHDVTYGMGLDPRIGSSFLTPGPGYGGSCFPKDVASLSFEMEESAENYPDNCILKAVDTINEQAKMWPVYKIIDEFYDTDICLLKPIKVCVLGCAFKAYTDDVRCSSTITLIEQLFILNKNVQVSVYDPLANDNLASYFSDRNYNIEYTDNVYTAAENADVTVLMTPWPEFLALNYSKIKCFMSGNVFIDTRAMLNYDVMNSLFKYYALGKPQKN